jgi:hypothetical protein
MNGWQDAATSMELVLHALQHGVKPVTPPEVKVPKEMLAKLFLHNLPAACTAADLTDLFARVAGCPVPISIEVCPTHRIRACLATDVPALPSHALTGTSILCVCALVRSAIYNCRDSQTHVTL